jgi:hypothetical protein
MVVTVGSAAIIDPTNRVDWVPVVTVGVHGGIPTNRNNLINVTSAPYNADSTGVSDCTSAIQSAINAAVSNDVVYLPTGHYKILSALYVDKSNITLRGDGKTNSIIFAGNTSSINPQIKVGHDAQNSADYTVASTPHKGDLTLTLTSASGITVGGIYRLADDLWQRSFSVQGYRNLAAYCVTITNVVGNTVYLGAPLLMDFTNAPSLSSVASGEINNGVFGARSRIGIENIGFTAKDGTNYGNAVTILAMSACVDSWILNCDFSYGFNYNIEIGASCHYTMRGNSIHSSQGSGSNHSGYLASGSYGLIEDNMFYDGLQPAIEFNGGFCGNAVFANFFTNNVIGIDCHNVGPMMNLWEANISDQNFEMDGYFGAAINQTLLRNLFGDTYTPLYFKRFSYNMQVVGNVLGSSGSGYYAFSHDTNGVAHQIIEHGRPNIGNQNYTGTNPPIAWNYPGNTWDYGNNPNGVFVFTNTQGPTNIIYGNFTNITAYGNGIYSLTFQDGVNTNIYWPQDGNVVYPTAGTSNSLTLNRSITVSNGWRIFVSGVSAYQQLQKQERDTHTISGNYDYFNNAVTWGTNADHTIPTSLLYASTPTWWGTNRWPAVDPESGTLVTLIPAQERYYGLAVGEGGDLSPTITITSPTSSSTYTTINGTIDLGGSSSDDNGVTSVTYVNAATGASGTATGTTSWNLSSLALNIGDNAITFTAHDTIGQTATDTITITRTAVSGNGRVLRVRKR